MSTFRNAFCKIQFAKKGSEESGRLKVHFARHMVKKEKSCMNAECKIQFAKREWGVRQTESAFRKIYGKKEKRCMHTESAF